jgi:hypothetical protein
MSNLSLDADDAVVQRRNSYLNPDLDWEPIKRLWHM